MEESIESKLKRLQRYEEVLNNKDGCGIYLGEYVTYCDVCSMIERTEEIVTCVDSYCSKHICRQCKTLLHVHSDDTVACNEHVTKCNVVTCNVLVCEECSVCCCLCNERFCKGNHPCVGICGTLCFVCITKIKSDLLYTHVTPLSAIVGGFPPPS